MKKIISLIMTALLLLQTVPFAITAASPVALLSSGEACPGEEVTLTLKLYDSQAVKAMYVAPKYNESLLTLKSGSWLVEGEIVENWSPEYGDAVFACTEPQDFHCAVFQLVFTVNETAPIKKVTGVSCTFKWKALKDGQEVSYGMQAGGAVTVLCPHTEKTQVSQQDATCLTSGNHMYYQCSCGAYLKADGKTVTTVQEETIPALGHNWTEYIEDEAHLRSKAEKCTEFDTYWCDCIRCDTINTQAYFYSKNAGDHSFTQQLQDAAHLLPGYSGYEPVVWYYYDCAYCDTIGSEAYSVACQHTNVTQVERVDANCLSPGNNRYLICMCGTVLKMDGVTVTTVEAEEIPALGHDEVFHAAQASTCTEIGWDAHVSCTRCSYNTRVEYAPLGHYWAECIEDEAHLRSTASKCTEYDTYWRDCTRCDNISTQLYFASAKAGAHSFKEQVTDEKHLVPGYSGYEPVVEYYYECLWCDTIGSETYKVACQHTQITMIPEVEATCAVSGNHGYYICQCGTFLEADGVTVTTLDKVVIPALGHDWSEATCTEAKTCQRESCHAKEGSALGHSWTEKLQDEMHLHRKAARCTEYNSYWYDCARCDSISSTKYFKSEQTGDHSFTEQVKDAAHQVPGQPLHYYYDCMYCDTMGTETYSDAIKGDMDGSRLVDEDDAIYLLQHVLMPEMFEVTQDVDFDGSGEVNEDDAIYLLQHVLMPEQFPLP